MPNEDVIFFEEEEDQEIKFEPLSGLIPELKQIPEIVVSGSDWTTETIFNQLDRGNIELNPRFQRRDAWDITRKSRFIESLVLGFPVPQIVLAANRQEKGKFIDTLNKPNNVSQDNHDKRLKVTEKINSAIKSFKKVIDNNHGVKEKNILALLLPIGINSNDLNTNTAWLNTMNTFGAKRGLVAHSSATSYMTIQTPDPGNELDTVQQINEGLLIIDELMNNLMQ
ncbi:DUF262 domain-containing protein [Aphanizomenon sp. CS-733/32]|uniref:DUF262 domain-containing protein n=1 Tax=Aphanizomenon sp. CS-733/32 TaxID=3021715 RepID=UPI00233121CA|nr:DUF262 domain-containing protein [Aphanizomenon sp. CS-733/32]MDB9308224.1 DUF262 domain-containing protein [Aphanizomenon sp. CS-733/32]